MSNNAVGHTREYQQSWRARRTDAGNCVKCSEPRGDNGTDTLCQRHAEEHRSSQREKRQCLIKEGRCADCGEPRGADGSRTKCSRHAKADKARSRAWYQRQRAADMCVVCGEPRGADGTLTMCKEHAADLANRDKARRQRRAAAGVCPDHKTEMDVLEKCPSCLFEESGNGARHLTFEGLLPRPKSGDRLEKCVGCERCGRRHHAGSSYYLPHHPRSVKSTRIHVGKKGRGLWLNFADVNEKRRILVEYEGCSTPDQPCTGRVSRMTALTYLWKHRKGEKIGGACYDHSRNNDYLIEAALLRQQQVIPAQVQNGDGQKNGGAEKRGRGRQAASKEKRIAELKDRLTHIRDKVLKRKAQGELRSSITAAVIAKDLTIGGDAGGTNMMQRLKDRGFKLGWPELGDACWDGLTVDQILELNDKSRI